MKKRIVGLITAVSVISAGSIPAMCAEITSVTLNDGGVKVTGLSDQERIAIKVIPSDDTEETSISNVVEMNEIVTADGKFEYSFKMPDILNGTATDGTYSLIVSGEKRDTYEFAYVSAVTRQKLIDSLNDSADVGSVFVNEEYKDAFSNLGVDVNFYKNLTGEQKESFVKIFKNTAGTDEITSENLSAVYDIAVIVQKINNGKTDDEVMSSYGFAFDDVEYKDVEDKELKSWIKSYLEENAPYEKTEEAEAIYEKANILYVINTAKYTEYDEVVEKYDHLINIKSEGFYKKYLEMTSSKKSSVNTALKNALAKNPVKDYDDFVQAYEDAYDEVVSEKKTTGGGGGGGSSSSGKSKVTGVSGGLSISGVEDYPAAEKEPEFSDMSSAAWAEEAVSALAKRGIISGYDDGTFKPNKEVTREEFVKMIILAMNINGSAVNAGFGDVAKDAWYAPYVNAAVEKGIVNGVSDDEFGIGKGIIRQDMAVIVKRAIGELPAIRNYVAFSDESNISDYAKDAVEALYKAGKISGMSEDVFAPRGAVTRAQAAKILYDTFVGGTK